ncbi:hypothetical protein SARC_11593 [Sphaeroforma arctica JP610]|uniref:Uncharacterized protein n=1 Tax=Sphaeroforma arctica JP610 TaxID=667725 RepID=A0A0L0FGI1_9EUKA|nr:hypothetical protein SARC_11593 [Sphaeroforma arctica JP610]KNC75889.1 hypothetical protein SARC_11593 [Sphaeroforma arctica JP610]|eukprot:XP_014149791.1 hypothetical protein SARC_11593 [Sphaeroforma arctica JP610]
MGCIFVGGFMRRSFDPVSYDTVISRLGDAFDHTVVPFIRRGQNRVVRREIFILNDVSPGQGKRPEGEWLTRVKKKSVNKHIESVMCPFDLPIKLRGVRECRMVGHVA